MSVVYFLQPVNGGPIKIGVSVNLESRIRQLEKYYARPLTLLATMPGDWYEEQRIHARFAHLRFGRTEQFQPAPELLEFIGLPRQEGVVDPVEPMKPGEIDGHKLFFFDADQEWVDTFDRICAKLGFPDRASFIDHLIAKDAKKQGFTMPPRI